MMHEIVSNVRVKGMNNVRIVVKTMSFQALKHAIREQEQQQQQTAF